MSASRSINVQALTEHCLITTPAQFELFRRNIGDQNITLILELSPNKYEDVATLRYPLFCCRISKDKSFSMLFQVMNHSKCGIIHCKIKNPITTHTSRRHFNCQIEDDVVRCTDRYSMRVCTPDRERGPTGSIP